MHTETECWYIEICSTCNFRNTNYWVGSNSLYKKVSDIKPQQCTACGKETHLELDTKWKTYLNK